MTATGIVSAKVREVARDRELHCPIEGDVNAPGPGGRFEEINAAPE